MKKVMLIVLGCVSLALGCIGVVLPVLPTVPFLLVTGICFANSSKKMHDWFIGTGIYKKYLESYVKKEGMTIRTKCTIIGSVTLLMSVGFIMMSRVPVGRIIIGIVWIGHIVYFGFVVKTIREMPEADMEE